MKINYSLLVLFCLLVSCSSKNNGDSKSTSSDGKAPSEEKEIKLVKVDPRKIGPAKPSDQIQIEEAINKMEQNKDVPVVGYWVGMFGKNKINIAIADIENGKVIGYSVCAGNFRPLNGTVTTKDDLIYTFDVREPGSDKYDGHFNFVINLQHDALTGTWKPFKEGVVADKQFELVKTAFIYEPANGEYPEASERILEKDDVANMLKEELEIMRNEIYARHGYSFKDKSMRRHFDTTAWYVPMGVDIRANLTDVEVENIYLIYTYENYYEEEYDNYGR
jgi:hypothetical protein